MSDNEKPTDAPHRNFYGRRAGKGLKKSQKIHMDTTLSRFAVDLDAPVADEPTWLEIGFGGGEHILHMADTYPDVTLIGCEAFVNGVAKLVSRVGEQGIENIRVHCGDARDLLEELPDACLEKVFLLYPDPWPKTRHHRRRFANTENFDQIARAMKPGAELRIATDIDDYVRHTLEALDPRDDFARVDLDRRAPWADWTRTRYEAKAYREGRLPNYLTFRRV